MSSRLGLFGGLFNPVHHGHLIAAQETMIELELGSVTFIPTHHPPHRSSPDISTEERIEMTRRAIAADDYFNVSAIERDLEGPSYTLNTIELFKERYPDRTLFWFTGADELLDFKEWHDWKKLLDRCQIVGMNRPGFDKDAIADAVREKIQFVEIPDIDVSSTRIRKRLREGKPTRYFLPEPVWKYINDQGLYES